METVTMQEDLNQTHHKRLLGIIHDALAFGGNAQLVLAYEALEILEGKMAAHKSARNCASDQLLAEEVLKKIIHERLIEIAEDGFNHPTTHMITPAAQALAQLRPKLDKRKADINKGAKHPATI
jgi:hypothetical protein